MIFHPLFWLHFFRAAFTYPQPKSEPKKNEK